MAAETRQRLGQKPNVFWASPLDRERKIRTRSPLHLEKDVEFYKVQLQPGGELRSEPHFKGTREFLTVQKGNIRVEWADDSADLNRTEPTNYPSDGPHAIINNGRGESVVFLVVIYNS